MKISKQEIDNFVKDWMKKPENLGEIPTNESGQYIFQNKNGDSINLGIYFEMLLEDYINKNTSSEEHNPDTEKYVLAEDFADNGEHSHWTLIETKTGRKLWSENPEECKAKGYPVVEN